MSLLVTGSIGIDTVETPFARADNVLGGSAVYFAFAAKPLAPVRLVGVVGEDFPAAFRDQLTRPDIDLRGLEVRKGSETFRWHGRYFANMNQRETVDVQLNVLAEAPPKVPAAFRDSTTVFLANTHPDLQRDLLTQLADPKLIVCDTMDLWITTQRESLLETLRRVTGVIVNDGEALQLTDARNVYEAGEEILGLGPRFVIIKKGEHGAVLCTSDGPVCLPAFPSKDVKDPTGAGDAFAGGVVAYLHAAGRVDAGSLRQALVHGTVAASFVIEDFSLRAMRSLDRARFDARVRQYVDMLRLT